MMRRWAAVTIVLVVVAGGLATATVALASPGGAKVTPGSIWTLATGARCESESFATGHTFAAAIDEGSGDQGKYKGSMRLKMTWKAGTATGETFKGAWHKATGTYSGTSVLDGQSQSATLVPASTVDCAVVNHAPESTTIELGTTDADTATVTGADGITPTGTVTFSVCGPETTGPCTSATGTPVGSSVAVSGSGDTATATSNAFAPTGLGTYCFVVTYAGGPTYLSVSGGSTAPQCFTVTPGGAQVTTAPGSGSVVLGESNADTATVTGANGVVPTGTVTFYECGPFAAPVACRPATPAASPDPVEIGSPVTLAPTSSSAATATSATFAPTTTGTYCFLAVYSGDGNFTAASDSSKTEECFAVTAAGPGFTTAPDAASIVLGTTDSDRATVTGQDGVTPTGTVTFYACGPNAAGTCTATNGTQLGSPANVTLLGGTNRATVASDAFTPTATGTYCFLGIYSGDQNYSSASDGSTTDECFTVTAATPVVTTAPATASIVLGGSETDAATVTGVGGVTPTGSVDFSVCPGDTSPCTADASGAVDVGTVAVSDIGDAQATASSTAFTPTTAGRYCFSGVYSGDGNYTSASDASVTDECFTVAPLPPIGLGSPENSFGTGNLSLGVGNSTNIWAAVNGYCTSKENGDEFLSAFDDTFNGMSYNCDSDQTFQTPNAVDNFEYNPSGYVYDIETPDQTPGGTVAAPLTVAAYDPSYNPGGCGGGGGTSPDNSIGMSNTTITTTYKLFYAPGPTDPPSAVNLMSAFTAGTNDTSSCGQWVPIGTIPAGSANGTYQLEVSTQAGQDNSQGSNAYGLEVYPGPFGSFSRCSTVVTQAWYSATCPVIEGQSAVSVYVNSASNTGTFYLANVGKAYDGKTMNIGLFDPGEGDHYLQILGPDGNPVPFSYTTTDECNSTPPAPIYPPPPNQNSTDCADSGGIPFPASVISGTSSAGNFNGTSLTDVLDVSGTEPKTQGESSNSEFNDRHLQLQVQIPSDSPGGWWQIAYYATGNVSDRTTWSVSMDDSTSTVSASPLLRSHSVSGGPIALEHRGSDSTKRQRTRPPTHSQRRLRSTVRPT
jgi:hypothetical protein